MVERVSRPPFEAMAGGVLDELPLRADNTHNWNSVPFTQDALCTAGDAQWVVWVGPKGHPYVSRRTSPGGQWCEPADLHALDGNPLCSPTDPDPHNSYVLAVDARGGVHVAGNVHNDELRYVVSPNGDLDEWQAGFMPDLEGHRVTYPTFVRHPDGTLLFIHREGRSAYGDVHLSRRPPQARHWEYIGAFIDGRTTNESPYINRVAFDSDGILHVSGCFRAKGGAAANSDVFYIRSRDHGTTWTGMDGAALATPISHRDIPLAYATTPVGSGLVNQTGMDVDFRGRPHIAIFQYDEAGNTQIVHIWHDLARWRSRQITNLDHRMPIDVPIVDASLARPQVACAPSGRVFVITRSNRDPPGSGLIAIEATPETPTYCFTLLRGEMGFSEPALDAGGLLLGRLEMLATRSPAYTSAAAGCDSEYIASVRWNLSDLPTPS